jgi:type VI secretion system secreted protein Hcp
MAVVDFFLKIDGIEGESQDEKHKGEIDIDSWNWGATQSGTWASGSGGGAGKVSMKDFNFTTKMNKASPKLMLACATGDHIKTAVLVCRKAGKEQQEYLKVTLSDCIISSYQSGGNSQGNLVPTESFSIDFAKIEIEYKEQKPDGTLGGAIKSGFDLAKNKKV